MTLKLEPLELSILQYVEKRKDDGFEPMASGSTANELQKEVKDVHKAMVALINLGLLENMEDQGVVGHSRMPRAVHLPCFLPHSVRLVSLNAKLKFRQTFDVDPLPDQGSKDMLLVTITEAGHKQLRSEHTHSGHVTNQHVYGHAVVSNGKDAKNFLNVLTADTHEARLTRAWGILGTILTILSIVIWFLPNNLEQATANAFFFQALIFVAPFVVRSQIVHQLLPVLSLLIVAVAVLTSDIARTYGGGRWSRRLPMMGLNKQDASLTNGSENPTNGSEKWYLYAVPIVFLILPIVSYGFMLVEFFKLSSFSCKTFTLPDIGEAAKNNNFFPCLSGYTPNPIIPSEFDPRSIVLPTLFFIIAFGFWLYSLWIILFGSRRRQLLPINTK